MRYWQRVALTAAGLLILVLGCAGQPDSVPTGELPPPPETTSAPDSPQQEPADFFENLAGPQAPEGTVFYAADDAPECPQIQVQTPEGREEEIQPGKAGFVTLLVFWDITTPRGQWAAKYAGDLAREYSRLRVRAVGVVAKTAGQTKAPAFARQVGIFMRLYFGDASQSALRTVADEAGAENERAMPATFIIDRQLRLRFYRPGFRGRKSGVQEEGRSRVLIEEDVPEGQSIEEYLRKVLRAER